MPPLDSSKSRALTTPADRIPASPTADSDEPDSEKNFGRSCERPFSLLKATHCRVSKIGLCRVNSRALVKVAFLDHRKNLWVFLILGLDFVKQRRKTSSGSGIACDLLPRCIAIQFWQQARQILDQLF